MDQAASAIASGSPLIDIDGTMFLQFGLFLVMYVIANRMLFQPYLALRERRRAGIEGARAEADRMTAEADAKLADYEKQLSIARAKGNEEGRKLRTEATAHERDVTEKARAAAQKAIEEASAKMHTEVGDARAKLMPEASVLAQKIASKLLGREVGGA